MSPVDEGGTLATAMAIIAKRECLSSLNETASFRQAKLGL